MSKSSFLIQLLTPQQTHDLWSDLEPLLQQACAANDIAKQDLTPESIYNRIMDDDCGVVLGRKDDKPAIVLVLQFIQMGNRKGASFLALAGSDLLQFKALYWDMILEWLRDGLGVKFIEAYASDRLATIYQNKFGFDTSCRYVRKNL